MINGSAFLVVAVATLVAALTLVFLFSLGVRLGAIANDRAGGQARALTWASRLCFAGSAVTVLYGVYLIVPVFH
ncbi:hypothetical protein GCM10011512_14800 [Tersicoccus solisilvae]|uniref:HIG1 domain-containing protein n=1 Tax=Tersicoccus solisilvae TaxID=1882339 RepID=A0ABQ1P1G5_9MICC|nr:hypothetical protein [Tersicoccus solisilvae]GGC88905.1 hypothetical protein GCM10011512_14800 [Tersicoccus solisilvae]